MSTLDRSDEFWELKDEIDTLQKEKDKIQDELDGLRQRFERFLEVNNLWDGS